MAQTLADVEVGDTWVDLYLQTGITVGDKLAIQNKSPVWVILHESNTSPAVDNEDGTLLGSMDTSYAEATISSGSLKIWAKSSISGKTAYLNVQ